MCDSVTQARHLQKSRVMQRHQANFSKMNIRAFKTESLFRASVPRMQARYEKKDSTFESPTHPSI